MLKVLANAERASISSIAAVRRGAPSETLTGFFTLKQSKLDGQMPAVDDGGYLSSVRVFGGLLPELFSSDIALSSSVSRNLFFSICMKLSYTSFSTDTTY
ncbi:unnamed protein product [Thlaspi arvense]|uniref:Uncharacterized protein n=1 Tax=Thlaspi arvense TaxID=13288 RepID=A0AAU9RNC3_THLAR|nr:unnamed protein product [Thlaspi arvense]